MNVTDLPHGQITLDAAQALAYILLQQRDEEERCILLAECLKVLSVSVDHTDAYGPLMNTAADISIQAERNIAQREQDASEHAQQWRASVRYRKAVAEGAV